MARGPVPLIVATTLHPAGAAPLTDLAVTRDADVITVSWSAGEHRVVEVDAARPGAVRIASFDRPPG